MKRLAFLFIISTLAVSCFKNTVSESTVNVVGGFEYTSNDYSEMFGSDSTFFPEYFLMGSTMACNAKFENSIFVGGCGLSIGKDPVISSSHTGSAYKVISSDGGVGGSQTYMVYLYNPESSLMPVHALQNVLTTSGYCTMKGCYVNNTNLVANSVLFGNGSQPAFKSGDWLKLTATGYLGTTETGSAEIYLADYTKTPSVLLTDWTAFDMTALGSVDYVDFSITSNVAGVPTYACFDNICFTVHIKQ